MYVQTEVYERSRPVRVRKTPMSSKHVEWIKQVLRRKPHLNQAGIARQIGLARSGVTHIMNGQRAIKAHEFELIEQYLGEKMLAPSQQASAQNAAFIMVEGEISDAWYEAGRRPRLDRRVSASLDHPNVRQVGYVLGLDMPEIETKAGDILIATPIDRSNKPRPGQTVVMRRERSGLQSFAIVKHVDGSEIEAGTPVAVGLEIRRRLP